MRVFKPTYVKMRSVKDANGRVVYGLKNGKKVARREPVLDENGNPVLVQARKWYIEFRDANDTVRRRPGFTDKQATRQLSVELERRAAQRQSGFVDRHAEHRKRPLIEHLEDWKNFLVSKGNTELHVMTVTTRARKVVLGCGFYKWSDLSATRTQTFIAGLHLGKRSASVQTKNFYLQAAKQFCRWMVQVGRAPENPLAHLQGGNVKVDRRHARRSFNEGELQALIKAADSGPDLYGLSGPTRARLYRLALETGLRASELRSLSAGSFDLDGDPPTVTVQAGYSKHRKEDVLPLRLRIP